MTEEKRALEAAFVDNGVSSRAVTGNLRRPSRFGQIVTLPLLTLELSDLRFSSSTAILNPRRPY
jgi:hypothetical protein